MAQALEEFEREIEAPLERAVARGERREDIAIVASHVQGVKRCFRKALQALSSDCLEVMGMAGVSPGDIQINAYEPVTRRLA